MQLMCGDLKIDHSKPNAKFWTLVFNFFFNNMSLIGFIRETIISQTRIDILICSQEVKVEVLKSTITDHYTFQTELDEKTKETGIKDTTVLRTLGYFKKQFCVGKASVQSETQITRFPR